MKSLNISRFLEKITDVEELVEIDTQLENAIRGEGDTTNDSGFIKFAFNRGKDQRDLIFISNGNKYRFRGEMHKIKNP